MKHGEDVAGRVAGCQDYSGGGIVSSIACSHTVNAAVANIKRNHFLIKVNLTAALLNGLPHGGNDLRKLISTNVGMGFIADAFIRAEVNEQLQDPVDITPLGRTGVELTIRICACTALSKAVVAFRVDDPFLVHSRQIPTAGANIPTALQNDW